MSLPDISTPSLVPPIPWTPMRVLRIANRWCERLLWMKLEQYNPTGSIKHRTAVALIESLHRQSQLSPGTRVVESTSGNLGVAMSRLLSDSGCQLVAVVDPKVPAVVREAMVANGAELVSVHERDRHGGFLLTRLARVAELCAADPSLRWSDQYNNPANPEAHRRGTAVEILAQTEGQVDAVLAAVSTGGTLTGLSEGVRAHRPGTAIYAVDALGSLVTSDLAYSHLLSGIGSTRKSAFLRREHYDHALRVSDVQAISTCRMLARDTGLALGGSSGAVVGAFAANMTGAVAAARRPVAIVADDAHHYRTTYYDDAWLAENGILDAVHAAVAEARADGLTFEIMDGAHAQR